MICAFSCVSILKSQEMVTGFDADLGFVPVFIFYFVVTSRDDGLKNFLKNFSAVLGFATVLKI